MAFNAGEIVARLVLNREEFDAGLDEALAKAEAMTRKGIEVEVKPRLDETDVAEVLAEEEPLRQPIRPAVEPSYAKGELTQLGNVIGRMLGQGVSQGVAVEALKGFGFTPGEIGTGLSSLPAGASATMADALVASMLPAPAAMEQAYSTWLRTSLQSLGQLIPIELGAGAQSLVPLFGPAEGGIGSNPGILTSGLMRGILGELGIGAPALGTGAADATFVEDILNEAGSVFGQYAPPGGGFSSAPTSSLGGVPGLIRRLLGGGASYADIRTGLGQMGLSSEEITAAIVQEMKGGINDLASNGGMVAVRRDFGATIQRTPFGGLSDAFDNLWGGSGPFTKALFNPIGASAGVAFLGAFGAAISGGLAATIIGSAGTMVALVPGFLDLMKGYTAYSALSSGGSLAGMSKSQIGLGKTIQQFLGSGASGLHGAENAIMPQITAFLHALSKAMPLMEEFARPAIHAMSRFFNAIDRGVGSAGFKSFMADMGHLVGPIMTEFGKVISNLAAALGGFLKLFGAVGKNQVGPWFVKITGELDHFLNHVKLGHGFITGMVTVFSNLGKVIMALWPILVKLAEGLAPIGMQVMRIVGWVAEWVGRIVHFIPTWLITAVLGFAIALKGVTLALDGIRLAMVEVAALSEMTPLGWVVTAIAAIVVAILLLHNHWRAVWGFIKKYTLDVWHFIDNDIIHPIADAFNKYLGPVVRAYGKLWSLEWDAIRTVVVDVWNFLYNDIFSPIVHFYKDVFEVELMVLKRVWDFVWGGIKTAVKEAWDFIKPIFDAITGAVGGVVGGIKDVVGAASGIAGGIGGAVSGVWNFLTGKAAGGPVSSGTPYIVGEQGPELFVPSTAGTIIPNGRLGGSQIVFNIDARGHADPSAIGSAVRWAIGATLPSLEAALARGAA